MNKPSVTGLPTEQAWWTQTDHVAWVIYFTFIIQSLIAVPIYVAFHVRAVAGPVGVMSAFMGFGCALWWSIRVRQQSTKLALIVSLVPFVLWIWLLYCAVYDLPLWPLT